MDDRRVLRRTEAATDAVDAIAAEFRRGFAAVAKIGKPGVTVFGSARVRDGDPVYESARECGRLLVDEDFAVRATAKVARRGFEEVEPAPQQEIVGARRRGRRGGGRFCGRGRGAHEDGAPLNRSTSARRRSSCASRRGP